MRTEDFDYTLPPELIAQTPVERRDLSRLMVLNRADHSLSHDRFHALGSYLHPGDVLVANRSRVVPARLKARKATGGGVELLLLEKVQPNRWAALARPSRKLRETSVLTIEGADLSARLEEQLGEGKWVIRFSGGDDVDSQLKQAGSLPLPPYIEAEGTPLDRYQTIYADRDGSVAAPTAGLHFSAELLSGLKIQGIDVEFVTLHVGLGTFRPVSSERVEEHQMHAEWGEIPADVAERINQARRRGGRLIAVGTTSTRLLETAAADGEIHPFGGYTDRFIYPGYVFQALDGLITNFHLPRSTLLMLVSAFADRDLVLEAYKTAIDLRYRFYSFGDAMLIL